jgi:hypothetical protein
MTDTTKTFNLGEAFFLRQEQLRNDLKLGDIATHPGTKGDDTELNWLGMLYKLLPNRYGVAKAFVIDVHGGLSQQIDIVIHDRHFSPLLFEVGGALYIPAESVYAAIEVKQTLDRTHIDYAADKVASVRSLDRTSVPIPYVAGIYDPKEPQHILGGILTRRSTWTPPFGEPFRACLHDLHGDHQLDIGCALEHGAFAMRADGSQRIVDHSRPDSSLITFVMTLLQQLQTMGSAPAINYDAYLKTIPGST